MKNMTKAERIKLETKAERIELEATLATILGISSPDQKFSIGIEGFNYKRHYDADPPGRRDAHRSEGRTQ